MPQTTNGLQRCFWSDGSALYDGYHDHEWGHPVVDDIRLFEKISLEGFQAGLSWITILRKREAFRAGFDGFDFHTVSLYTARDVERLLADAGIVRHRGKIEAAINNAQRALELKREAGSLAAYFWRFEPPASERPTRHDWDTLSKLGKTPSSIALSRDLQKRGWRFVGPTTMYALMQAMGIVNDHVEGCAWREIVAAQRSRFTPPEVVPGAA